MYYLAILYSRTKTRLWASCVGRTPFFCALVWPFHRLQVAHFPGYGSTIPIREAVEKVRMPLLGRAVDQPRVLVSSYRRGTFVSFALAGSSR